MQPNSLLNQGIWLHCIRVVLQSIMQKIGAIPKSPNRYQQLYSIAFAICVSVRYGIIDYPWQR